MTYPTYRICISDYLMHSKDNINHPLIWQTMHPVTITMADLKKSVIEGHPFLCCQKKSLWDGQQLFGIDIDNFNAARGKYTFKQFIAILDALGIPPCLGYTTFNNPNRKKERFRLLFKLTEPVTKIKDAWQVSKLLFNIVNELIPGAPDKNCKRPYCLFYPGKKIILYRPNQSARKDILFETIRFLEQPKIIIKTTEMWTKLQETLLQNPYVPSVQFKRPPPGLLLILGLDRYLVSKNQIGISTSLGIQNIGIFNNQRICYNILLQKKILDIYYNSVKTAEQSKSKNENATITVFEHYEALFNELLCRFCELQYCNTDTAKIILSQHKNVIYQAIGIQILSNTPMALPKRYAQYAKAVQNLSIYPNLFHLFQCDARKSQVLACIIWIARDISIKLEEPSHILKQYIITHQMIQDKLKKKFKCTISQEGLTKWLQQFDTLQLIHICKEEEIAASIKNQRKYPINRPTVLQIPYFDKNTLIYSEQLAAKYKPPIKKIINNENYKTVKTVLSYLLDSRGWFSRDSFIDCIRMENETDNVNGFTIENAKTYFDKYIQQIQQELDLTKSSCTKELIARFPGNHKVGLTKLYYRGG